MKKRMAVIVLGMLLTFALCGCSKRKEASTIEEENKESVKSLEIEHTQNTKMFTEQKESVSDSANGATSSETISELSELNKKTETLGTDEAWQDVYGTILCDLENHLSDPYDLRLDFNGYSYLGIHDFDKDGIPEFIAGDSVSVAVFTYLNGEAVKIADLYEPEYWGGINQLCYKNNTLLLVSNGSDGNGYLCFTYKEGEYIKGFYDDYEEKIGLINESQVSKEEFEGLFLLDELMQNSRISYSQINMDNKTIIINNHTTKIDQFDWNQIQW